MNKKTLPLIFYNVLVVFILLGAIELTFTFLLNNPKYIPAKYFQKFKRYYISNDRKIIQFEDNCAVYDSRLFYTLKPGNSIFKNREFNTEYEVNSMGLRDDEESLYKPKIIVLGDSYAMGWGVDQAYNFAQLLESTNKQKVLNAGISSFGTARELKLLNQLDYSKTEYLIIQFCANDYTENLSYYEHNYTLKVSSLENYQKQKEKINRVNKYYFLKHSIYLGRAIFLEDETAQNPIESAEEEPLYEELSQAELFLNILQSNEAIQQIPNIIISDINYFPTESFIEELSHLLSLKKYQALRKKIKLVDLTAVFTKQDYFLLDNHLNKQGHQKIADIFTELIYSNSYKEKEIIYFQSELNFNDRTDGWSYNQNAVIDGSFEMNPDLEWGPKLEFNLNKELIDSGYVFLNLNYEYEGPIDSSGLFVLTINNSSHQIHWEGKDLNSSQYSYLSEEKILVSNRFRIKTDLLNINPADNYLFQLYYWNSLKKTIVLDHIAVSLSNQKIHVY